MRAASLRLLLVVQIGEGAEMLMLVPSLAGVVGSVILPVLGAVPDGAIVLFSGMGSREEVEASMPVGIGALAGSTVMLLTIPWVLSIKVAVFPHSPVQSRPWLLSIQSRVP